MTIAVAVSGGTDSLYALLTLKEQGHDIFALHAHFLAPSKEREEAIGAMCASLDVPFHAVDLHEEFEQCVVTPFMDEYIHGRTPNPCALCNASMKFGALLREAEKLGANQIATGHYAVLEDNPLYGRTLSRGHDPKKDQSYFLSLVPKKQLEKALFPLGKKKKEDIKAELAERGIAPAYPSESQEICFVPNDDYRAFLIDRGANLGTGGNMELADGTVVGKHNGLWQYTEGQRKGLGVAWKEPLYVIRKDMEKNVLIVGPKTELLSTGCVVSNMNFLVAKEHWGEKLLVRTRYRQLPIPVTISEQDDLLIVTYDEPQSPPASGQVCCVYDENLTVLGGGIIEHSL
ncbi:tRNA 2-thiouridine(34) synthase MnmA [Halodesulfovibrio marinisediminis]|uniref:tRNA-specific 2-thiouridylase MnmA n=1 Tax=Halodesulfovibrio marinisediminis DSM 17456 TaxID=1121457 RepID=A0A1N6IT62_9BACT|nr:tRNA 2-thiouridine(34) synthase MnmA [Halodesulfovibrio marinisediminis]SIO35178.1 tRNA-specific 2-thiouridylase [Halodesulfovibrio marinisediminis DSM 17456]